LVLDSTCFITVKDDRSLICLPFNGTEMAFCVLMCH